MSSAYDGPKTGPFRVWHIPQVPMRAFVVDCETLDAAVHIRDVLAFYDLFQYEQKVKPDYCSASGIMQWLEDDDGDGAYIELDDDEIAEQIDEDAMDATVARLRAANLKEGV